MHPSISERGTVIPSDYSSLYALPRRSGVIWLGYLVTKRLMDIVLAMVGLLVLSPLLAGVALAVLVDSGWPIVFVQDRVGKDGKLIRVLKFRSMHNSAPKYSLKIAPGDAGITRLGRFLRRSSIDEIPQLVNVIRGEMSLVGPRPEQPWIVEYFYEPWQYRRLSVNPGLTGWWQVNGRSDKLMHENTALDLHYVDNQSLWLDLGILLKTVGVVLGGKGAR